LRAALALAVLAVVTLAVAARADAFLYWTPQSNDTIFRANADGSGISPSFITDPSGGPIGLAVDGAHVYWSRTDTSAGTIGRANINGSGVDPSFIGGPDQALGVALDAAHIYGADLTQNSIRRANLDGTGVEDLIPGAGGPQGVVVDGTHIYWTTPFTNTILQATIGGADVKALITGAHGPSAMAIDSAHIYWTNQGNGTIGRANLDGKDADQGFITGADTPDGVAVDGAHVYWANRNGNTIGRADLAGTNVDQGFISTPQPGFLAIDGLTGTPPPPKIAEVVATVQALGLAHGTERSLLAKLDAGQKSLDAGRASAACGPLGAFANEVRAQSGKKIPGAHAAALIESANSVSESVGCGPNCAAREMLGMSRDRHGDSIAS
jgi:hypothetical protein